MSGTLRSYITVYAAINVEIVDLQKKKRRLKCCTVHTRNPLRSCFISYVLLGKTSFNWINAIICRDWLGINNLENTKYMLTRKRDSNVNRQKYLGLNWIFLFNILVLVYWNMKHQRKIWLFASFTLNDITRRKKSLIKLQGGLNNFSCSPFYQM